MSRLVGFIMLFSVTFNIWAQEPPSGDPPEKDIPAHIPQDTVTIAKSDTSKNDFQNTLELGYRYENFFDNYSDRTFLYVQYGRRIKQVDLFGRVLRYTLGDILGYQFETEAYWRFRKPGYMYFNAAYSNAIILPNYRLRAEIFQVANRFEYSFGLGVVKPFNFELIPVITGTIGYYFGNSYIYARPTFTYVENGFTKSIFIQARQYFTKTDFIALSALRGADTGTSRDISSIANSFGNDTYLVRFHGQFKAGRYKLGAGLDYGGIYIPERSEYARFVGIDVFINREF